MNKTTKYVLFLLIFHEYILFMRLFSVSVAVTWPAPANFAGSPLKFRKQASCRTQNSSYLGINSLCLKFPLIYGYQKYVQNRIYDLDNVGELCQCLIITYHKRKFRQSLAQTIEPSHKRILHTSTLFADNFRNFKYLSSLTQMLKCHKY
jgi:hypothetical protein